MIKHRLVAKCSKTKARCSEIVIDSAGQQQQPVAAKLPCYMPVGTAGAMKAMLIDHVDQCGYKIILANTYHLAEKIGEETLRTIKKRGGIKQFIGWPHALLTDSGGFQMVSLSKRMKVTDEGVEFTSPFTDRQMLLTPEQSMNIQNLIGSDIIMQLDDVVSSLTQGDRVKVATQRSLDWLKRCKTYLDDQNDLSIAENGTEIPGHLFPIVQGGLDKELRSESARGILKYNCQGYAIGGLSGGEEKELFCEMVDISTTFLPEDKPRYVMGVGFLIDQLLAIALGADMFDCVYPTRTARFGNALTIEGRTNLKNSQYKDDPEPICSDCSCYTCKNKYSRAFLYHTVTEIATLNLISIHNLHYHFNFMAQVQKSIEEDKFVEFAAECFLKHYKDRDLVPNFVIHCFKLLNIDILQYM